MSASSNKLLSSLSTSDFDLLAPHLESVTLGLRKMLEQPNKKIEAVYFPETGLRQAIQASASLRDSLLKFVQAFGVQTTHTAVCNAQSKIEVRLARWLLMAHDRIQDDALPLTHEFVSLMLAVRRPGVTDAMKALRQRGLISYRRGEITINDRKGMVRVAGETYGTPESEYRRLIG